MRVPGLVLLKILVKWLITATLLTLAMGILAVDSIFAPGDQIEILASLLLVDRRELHYHRVVRYFLSVHTAFVKVFSMNLLDLLLKLFSLG